MRCLVNMSAFQIKIAVFLSGMNWFLLYSDIFAQILDLCGIYPSAQIMGKESERAEDEEGIHLSLITPCFNKKKKK